MRLETEFLLLGWGLVGAIVANALFSESTQPEGRRPVDFWRAMEVLGLWAAAGVGLAAIYFSARDSTEQVRTMRDQLQAMSGQLDEMQREGRPWIGPAGATLDTKDRDKPLYVTVNYKNYGKQPAFVGHMVAGSFFPLELGKPIENLRWWTDARSFNPKSLCQIASSYQMAYPGDALYTLGWGPSEDNPVKDKSQSVPIQLVLNTVTQKQRLYVVYGCFTYTAVGKREFTTFCLMLDPRTGSNADVATWKFAFCPYGNGEGELTQDNATKQNGANETSTILPSGVSQ